MKSSLPFRFVLVALFISVGLNLVQFFHHVTANSPKSDGSDSAQSNQATSVQSAMPTLMNRRPESSLAKPEDVGHGATPVDEDPIRVRIEEMDEAIQKAGDLLREYAANFPEEEHDPLRAYIRQFFAPMAIECIVENINTLPVAKRLEPMGEALRLTALESVQDFDGRVYGTQYGPTGLEKINGNGWTYQDFLDVYDARRDLIAQDIREVNENLPLKIYEAQRYRTKLMVAHVFLQSLEAARLTVGEDKDGDDYWFDAPREE